MSVILSVGLKETGRPTDIIRDNYLSHKVFVLFSKKIRIFLNIFFHVALLLKEIDLVLKMVTIIQSV